MALLQHPGVNASFQGESIRVFHRAHIGIAVALEDGLITPVLRDVHAKSLGQIAAEARDLAERARQRKLRAPEMSGATFSISNLGMFDVTSSRPSSIRPRAPSWPSARCARSRWSPPTASAWAGG